jgi:hypothetical protein
MLQGHLHQLPRSKKWVVRYNRTPQIITELPVNPKDAELLTKKDDVKPVVFQVETVAIGTSEHDIQDCDVATILYELVDDSLYGDIELAIISWCNDGTKTAGFLTREIIDIINKYKK